MSDERLDGLTTHTRTFSGSASLHEARSFVASALAGTSSEALEIISLMVSELATNATLHAGTDFAVSVSGSGPGGRLRVEVSDTGGGRPILRHPDVSEPHGRGLQIVAGLSERWGIDQDAGQLGKTVWFEVTEVHLIDTPGASRAIRDRSKGGALHDHHDDPEHTTGTSARWAGAGGDRPNWGSSIVA